jgi:hypothetical protein
VSKGVGQEIKIEESSASGADQFQKLNAATINFELAPEVSDGLRRLAEQQARISKGFADNIPLIPEFDTKIVVPDALQRLMSAIPRLELPNWSGISAEFTLGMENFARVTSQLTLDIDLAKQAMFGQAFQQMALVERRAKRLEHSGWLPHYTTPFNIIDECEDDSELLRQKIGGYYFAEWVSVRSKLTEHILQYNIDQESKETFLEALDAHEAGLFRCVCRVLFPEVERLSRIELLGNALPSKASQKDLRGVAGDLTMSETEPGGRFALDLYRKLEKHLYANVESTTLIQYEQDSVPNRHAALHGLVAYRTAQNSLNTIIMTDYIFQVIHAAKLSVAASISPTSP